MPHAVIAATGLFTPEQSISNAELVAAYNAWAERWNADHALQIAEGDVAALTPSSVEFIEKASGIKSRFVLDKAGILEIADTFVCNKADYPGQNELVKNLREIAGRRPVVETVATMGKGIPELLDQLLV